MNLYNKNKIKIIKKKEELYKKKDKIDIEIDHIGFINKEKVFKLLLPKETKELNNMKMQFFYYGTNVKNEFDILTNKIEKRVLQIFKCFYNKLIDELNKSWDILKTN